MLKQVFVMTTIQPPTQAMRQWAQKAQLLGGPMIVIGDKKGPAAFELTGTTFYSLQDQARLGLKLAAGLPVGHYARKNLGYLLAMKLNPQVIFETDDDNFPKENWETLGLAIRCREVHQQGWANAYRIFTSESIWPRGLPLPFARQCPATTGDMLQKPCAIQQGLADGSPDVDAIWRLTQDRPITFSAQPPARLGVNAWCPFNSQCTWWHKPAWPLMYLPSGCTFRMTDIWRSFVAQRCLWAMDHAVGFLPAMVFQERNAHDLMKDFTEEVPGYLKNDAIAKILMETELERGEKFVLDNLVRCYEALVREQVLPREEMGLLGAWVEDVGGMMG